MTAKNFTKVHEISIKDASHSHLIGFFLELRVNPNDFVAVWMYSGITFPR
jgi:hypothetical protein